MYDLSYFTIFEFFPVLLINLLQMDPNFCGESPVLQEASLLPMDPAKVWNHHSAIASQGQLLGNHAQQLQCNSSMIEKVVCPSRGTPWASSHKKFFGQQ